MATTEVDRMVVRLIGDTSQYVSSMKKAVITTEVAMKRIGRSMTSLGRTLSMRLTLPLSIFGGFAVRAFAKFDQAMIESTSIMKVTEEQTKRMRQTALSLSGEIPQSATDLGEAYFFLASAGKNAEQSMALLPKVAAFATAGAFDMATATDLLTDAQSALGLASKDVATDTQNLTRVGDLLVKSNTLSNASVQQFATSLTTKAGSAIKAYNIELEDGLALLNAYADQGIKAELAGNALDRVVRLLTKAYASNAKEFERLNVAVFDGAGEFRKFEDIIGDIERATKDMSTQQKAAALSALGFEARIQGVILPLLGSSKAIGEYRKELKAAGEVTKRVAEKQLKSFSNQMKILWNRVKNLGISIGEILAPMFIKLNELIGQGLAHWNAFAPSIKKTIVLIGVAAAAIGPLLIALGGLATALGFIASGLSVVIPLIGAGLSAAAAAALSPIGLLTAAVVGLGTVVLTQTELGGQALEWFGKQWDSLIEHIQPAIDGIKNALKAGEINLTFKIMWAQIKLTFAQGIAPLREAWVGFVFTFKKVFIEASSVVMSAWQNAMSIIAKSLIMLQGFPQDPSKQKIDPKFSKFNFDKDAALKQIDEMNKVAQASIGKNRQQMLNEAEKNVVQDFKSIQDNINRLKTERDKLAEEARKEVITAEIVKPPAAEVAKEEVKKVERVKQTEAGKRSVSAGVKVGSREAFELLAKIGGGKKDGIENVVDRLDRQIEIMENEEKEFEAANLGEGV